MAAIVGAGVEVDESAEVEGDGDGRRTRPTAKAASCGEDYGLGGAAGIEPAQSADV